MTSGGARRERFTVEASDANLRLDQLLAARIDGLSRRKARVLLEIGGVYVDGQRVKVAGRKVRVGQVIEAVIGAALERARGQGEAARVRDVGSLLPLSIVFEDDDLVVIDKPAGVLAAPTPEGDRGNAADQLSRRGADRQPVSVVHRIDRPTSGLLVYAKSKPALAALSERFRTHDIERVYDAIVAGVWPEALLEIREPIAGRAAVSFFSIREKRADSTWLEVRLETGRTHQIRIHTSGAGHPILGDRKHGTSGMPRFSRLALHARVLGFVHPRTGETLRFESPTPAAFL